MTTSRSSQDDDIFNGIDWPLSDSASFKVCTELSPDRLKEMTHSKAFWNAVMNRWNLRPLVEAWSSEQLTAIVSAFQDIPANVPRTPRMNQALEKIFDEITMLGIEKEGKLSACVSVLKIDSITPLIRAMDPMNVPIGEVLFPKVLLDMSHPSQREFLAKTALHYSAPERFLPLLNDEQLEASIPENPDSGLVKTMFSLNNPRIIKAFLKKMPSDFFRKDLGSQGLEFVNKFPTQLIDYLEDLEMVYDYLSIYLSSNNLSNPPEYLKIRFCHIFDVICRPDHQWKLFVMLPKIPFNNICHQPFTDWIGVEKCKEIVSLHEHYHKNLQPILIDIRNELLRTNTDLSKLKLETRLTERDFQILLAIVLAPLSPAIIGFQGYIDWETAVLSLFHPVAKKRILRNPELKQLYGDGRLTSLFSKVFPPTEIFSLHDAQELNNKVISDIFFYCHKLNPKIHVMRVPIELHGLQYPENQKQIPGDVELIFGSQTITAHKSILASESFFNGYLTQSGGGVTPQKINIPIPQKLFENYVQAKVDLAYGGVLNMSQLSLLGLDLQTLPPLEKTESRLKNLVNNPLASDVLFKVGKQKFFGHKAILAARSTYFAKLLYGGMKETNKTEIEFTELAPHAFLKVLEYLYTDTVELSDDVGEVLIQADRFQIDVLRKQCVDHIKANKAEFDESSLEVLRKVEPSL